MSINAYKVNVKCNNCGWAGNMTFDKGCTVALYHCPNCDCKALAVAVKESK